MSTKFGYRADIDGLRAIAVLAVVIFHIDPDWLPGGFVGVDMFFVISGFLITGIILRQSETGTFSFKEFYRRRVLRILPAATLVIVTSLVVGQLAMLPSDFAALAASAAAAQMWSANIYFTYALDTGYFADAAALNPLLHLWSLGVEEQFYLIWPAILVAMLRNGRSKTIWTAVGLMGAISLISGQLIAIEHQSFAYYMLPSRAGQLLAGALVAAALLSPRTLGAVSATLSSLAGLLLILWSLIKLDGGSTYPGFNSVPVTIGTALLLLTGWAPKNLVSMMLSIRPLRMVGLISYSLYLWHWPILSFWWYIFGEPSLATKICLGVLMLAISAISYSMIEARFRHLDITATKAWIRFGIVPAAAVLSLVALVQSTSGYGLMRLNPSYEVELDRRVLGAGPAYSADYVCQGLPITATMTEDPACEINGKEPNVLLWGDSNAAHYVGAMRVAAEQYGFSFRNIAHASCPPVFNDPSRYVDDRRKKACAESVEIMRVAVDAFPTLVISASWDTYFASPNDFEADLSDTIEGLIGRGHRVLVVGRVPRLEEFDRHCQEKQVKMAFLDCSSRSQAKASATREVNAKVASVAERAGATYLDFNAAICDDETCLGYIDQSSLYYDQGHWSVSGSVTVGEHLRDSNSFPPALSTLAQRADATKGSDTPSTLSPG